MRYRLVTDATSEPVTLTEAKDYCRIDDANSDVRITSLISAARRNIENETGLALLTQTWVGVLDRYPDTPAPDYKRGLTGGYSNGFANQSSWWDGMRQGAVSMFGSVGMIEIGKRPFQSVDSIKIRGIDTTFSTVSSSSYYVETSGLQGRIGRVPGASWDIQGVALDGIEIQFKCGYGDAASAVPDDLKLAIQMLVLHWYESREAVTDGRFGLTSRHLASILQPYKALRLR